MRTRSRFSRGNFGVIAESTSLLPMICRRRSRVDDLDATTARAPSDISGVAFFASFGTLAMGGCSGLVALLTGPLSR